MIHGRLFVRVFDVSSLHDAVSVLKSRKKLCAGYCPFVRCHRAISFLFFGGWLLAPDVYSAGLLSLWSQTAVNRGEDEE